MAEILASIRSAVMEGNAGEVESLVRTALDDGISPKTILDDSLIDGMTEVGQLFENGEYFVPEMLVSARAMKAGLSILRPLLIEQSVEPVGRVVIGTVRGDMHDIGKNLVGMMMEGAGFDVDDLGVNVSADQFVEAAISGKADIMARPGQEYELRLLWEGKWETSGFGTEFDAQGNYINRTGSKVSSEKMEDGRTRIRIEHEFDQQICDDMDW